MAWAGAVFNRLYSWVADRDASVNILASRMDAEFDNYKSGLEALLLANGNNGPTNDIIWNNKRIAQLGDALVEQDAVNLRTMLKFGGTAGANIVRNGGFNVAQRGTSFVNPSDGTKLLDGWRVRATGGAVNAATISHVPAQDVVSGGAFPTGDALLKQFPISKVLKWDQTATTGASLLGIEQRFEDPLRFDGKFVSLTFLAKTAQNTTQWTASFGVNFGTGGSPSAELELPLVASVQLSTNLQQVSFYLTSRVSLVGKTFGSNSDAYAFLRINFGGTSLTGNAAFTKYISGVTLIVSDGSVLATSFPYRSEQAELALCQRYYESSFGMGVAPTNGLLGDTYPGMVYTSNTIRSRIAFCVPKAKTPSVVIYNPPSGATSQLQWYNGTSWGNASGTNVPGVSFNLISFVVDGTITGSIGSAFLTMFNWTADAEL